MNSFEVTVYPPKKPSYRFYPRMRALASIKREVGEHCGDIGGAEVVIVTEQEVWHKTVNCRWSKTSK